MPDATDKADRGLDRPSAPASDPEESESTAPSQPGATQSESAESQGVLAEAREAFANMTPEQQRELQRAYAYKQALENPLRLPFSTNVWAFESPDQKGKARMLYVIAGRTANGWLRMVMTRDEALAFQRSIKKVVEGDANAQEATQGGIVFTEPEGKKLILPGDAGKLSVVR